LSAIGRVSNKTPNKTRKVRRARVQKILSEIVYVLKRDPKLLDDEDVRRWLLLIFSIAMIYGDSEVKKFFGSLRAKLIEQSHQ